MSWQTIVRTCMLVMLTCVARVSLTANTIMEVGASNKVSALPVFASQPIESADTVKSFDQLAKELMEEKNRGDEVSDPDSIIALKLKEHYAPTVCLPQPIRHVCAELPTRSR